MVRTMRHRQTKGPETDRPDLTHRATSRLYRLGDEFWSEPLNLVRGVFDLEVRRKPQVYAAVAVIVGWDYGY